MMMFVPRFREICCYYCRTFISISCMTSGKTSMELEWAISVCIRRQFMMVVGTVFSMFPLRSTSSSSSNLAILLKNESKGLVMVNTKHDLLTTTVHLFIEEG